jgi:hypothetical protein
LRARALSAEKSRGRKKHRLRNQEHWHLFPAEGRENGLALHGITPQCGIRYLAAFGACSIRAGGKKPSIEGKRTKQAFVESL